jgi:hypothetical protein
MMCSGVQCALGARNGTSRMVEDCVNLEAITYEASERGCNIANQALTVSLALQTPAQQSTESRPLYTDMSMA